MDQRATPTPSAADAKESLHKSASRQDETAQAGKETISQKGSLAFSHYDNQNKEFQTTDVNSEGPCDMAPEIK